MEVLAHGLWAAAAAITAKKTAGIRAGLAWTVWWAAFPDVLAFGTPVVLGVARWVAGGFSSGAGPHRGHIGLPLYAVGHSLLVFLAAFGIASIVARRFVLPMLGWMLHILIDIPTHSYSYHATRFLWPLSAYGFDGIAWWTPWLWAATYAALAVVYFLMWKKGWLSAAR